MTVAPEAPSVRPVKLPALNRTQNVPIGIAVGTIMVISNRPNDAAVVVSKDVNHMATPEPSG